MNRWDQGYYAPSGENHRPNNPYYADAQSYTPNDRASYEDQVQAYEQYQQAYADWYDANVAVAPNPNLRPEGKGKAMKRKRQLDQRNVGPSQKRPNQSQGKRDRPKKLIEMGLRKQPRQSYLADCQLEPRVLPDGQNPLRMLVIDLNGTMVYRNKSGGAHGRVRPFARALLRYCLGPPGA